MARGLETAFTLVEPGTGTTYDFDFNVWIAGPDIPGGAWNGSLRVNLLASDTLAIFEAKRAAAIRAKAVELGGSIGANLVLLCPYKPA